MDLEKFLKLEKRLKESLTDIAREEGAVEQLSRQLEDEFGCKDLKEARKLLRDMQQTDAEEEHDREVDEILRDFNRRTKG